MVDAMVQELEIRKNYLDQESIQTIYFGGGTPSFIAPDLIEKILRKIKDTYSLANQVEITVECNPDDISQVLLKFYKSIGVNRLSMGLQSFDDNVLRFMNRAHSRNDIYQAVTLIKETGFENSTVDLIYGLPGKELDYWKRQLDEFLRLDVPHLSAYCLTIEPKTYFGSLQRKGKFELKSDNQSIEEFQYLIDFMRSNKYEQYEISNFAKNGFISMHNSAYWLGEKYLGIGPSSHSYNLSERSWNVSNNAEYIRRIKEGVSFSEIELLSVSNKYNDYILTRFRTTWGIVLADLDFAGENCRAELENKLAQYLQIGLVEETQNGFRLTDAGKYQADGIAADLFI